MLNSFWSEPLFWIVVYLVGYSLAIIGLYSSKRDVLPQRIRAIGTVMIVLLFIVPPLVLPLTSQPELALPTPLALGIAVPILVVSGIVGALAQKKLTAKAVLTGERKKLVTAGIYGAVRHPIYLANVLYPVGWAIIFRATYALLLTPFWFVSYVPIILLEEKRLEKEYGEKYRKYKRKVGWRMIPKIF